MKLITLMFITILIIHRHTVLCKDDANYYSLVKLDNGLLAFLIERYKCWSARVLVDIAVVYTNRLGMTAWKVIDSAVFTSIAISLDSILNQKKSILVSWVICLSVVVFPYETMGSAGWIATSAGYSWALAAGLIAFIPINSDNAFPKRWFPLFIICYLYATDAEQFTGITIVGLLVYVIYKRIFEKSAAHYYIKTLFIIAVIKAFFILLAPGNKVRLSEEVGKWFPGYPELSFIDKVYMGILYTARVLLDYPFIITITFILLTIIMFVRKENIKVKVLSIVSLIMIVALSVGQNWIEPFSARLLWIRTIISTNVTGGDIKYNILVLTVVLCIATSIFVQLIIIYNRKAIWYIGLVLLGVISQMAMVFSPTIYASSYRTGVFLYFSFIILNIICSTEIINEGKEKSCIALWSVLITICLMNVLNQYVMQ